MVSVQWWVDCGECAFLKIRLFVIMQVLILRYSAKGSYGVVINKVAEGGVRHRRGGPMARESLQVLLQCNLSFVFDQCGLSGCAASAWRPLWRRKARQGQHF